MTDAPPTVPSRFDPGALAARWQEAWERAEAFRAPERPDGSERFSLILPPPNVTGVLTLGHMLGGTVMDVFARYHRMRGLPTLWLPGVDHAGLATQVEVRRALAKQGVRFEELPRAEALAAVEKWRVDHEETIGRQLRAAGFSLDWSRYRYTRDPGAVRATREAFVRLYREGLLYRAERMVNWDPHLRTAISDLEVVHAEQNGTLVYLEYRWADGSPGGLEVATVRPETIFGDVAVAVHPDDARYAGLVGRSVLVPLVDRPVPIVADAAIDPAFGSGVLKVTPRHDPVDLELFRRHPELAMPPEIFDPSARLTGEAVPADLRGCDREEARKRTVEQLRAAGRLRRETPYRHAVARSERSDAVIEPRLSTQWFVRMRPLAEPAVRAVREGRVRIHPARWTNTYFRWMEEIQDWCISRQVLWGHPIPVDRCRACGRETVEVEPPTVCAHCGAADLEPDPDVLDTWFTSWLWPFAALGWPDRTADLDRYYPTSVLVTGRDIMFFWVARMMMAGEHFTGRAPFEEICFTGMLRDESGRRMSKHLGNSPEPTQVMAERGVDALRFAVLFPNPMEEDGPFGRAALDGGGNFLTKIWNLVRFTLPRVPPGTPPVEGPPGPEGRSLADRWILARYRRTAEEVDRALRAFEPSRAAAALHAFAWHDLADRFVEIAKEPPADEPAARAARATLLYVVERTVRLLHPFAPHTTEELWHALPHDGPLLARAAWPDPAEAPEDAIAEAEMEIVLETIRLLRNLRAEEHVPADSIPAAWVRAPAATRGLLERERPTVERLARVHPLDFLPPASEPPVAFGSRVAPFGECYLARPAAGPAATETLAREREMLAALLAKTRGRLADEGFRARAPPAVVREAEEKARELADRLRRIDEHLSPSGSEPPPA